MLELILSNLLSQLTVMIILGVDCVCVCVCVLCLKLDPSPNGGNMSSTTLYFLKIDF